MAGGRPKKPIDYAVVYEMAGEFCTQDDIAEELNISVRTLQRDDEFCRVYKKGLQAAKCSLRRKQYAVAMLGDKTMLIWLGKQYLDQSDKVQQELTGKDGEQLVVKFEIVDGRTSETRDVPRVLSE